MLVVLYQFIVKPDQEEQFVKNWAIVTDAIHRTCGSLGSRLHLTEKPLTYIAYAQWPSDEVYDRPLPIDDFSDIEREARVLMKEACEKIETLHRLHVVDDRLVK